MSKFLNLFSLFFVLLNETLRGLMELGKFFVYVSVVALLFHFFPWITGALIGLIIFVVAAESFNSQKIFKL